MVYFNIPRFILFFEFAFPSPFFIISPPVFHITFPPFFMAEFLGFMCLLPVVFIVLGDLFPIRHPSQVQTFFAGRPKFVPRRFARVEPGQR